MLGTVGPVTAEMVKDVPGVYRAGDEAGLSGLEARYDEQLRGTPGVPCDAVDAEGSSRELFTRRPGRPASRCAPPSTRGCSSRPSGRWPA